MAFNPGSVNPAMMQQMMNNPAMMQQMQQMMSNPAMMQNMQRMMSGMSPEELARMQSQATGMNISAEQARKAQEKIQEMTPEEIQSEVPKSQERIKQVLLSDATLLKAKGNELHKAGKHVEAIEKYAEAFDKIKGSFGANFHTLRTACLSNTAACNLKLERYNLVIDGCTEILSDGPNRKAYYRRALAYEKQGNLDESCEDLEKAAALDPSDAVIKNALSRVQSLLETQDEVVDPPSSPKSRISSKRSTPASRPTASRISPSKPEPAKAREDAVPQPATMRLPNGREMPTHMVQEAMRKMKDKDSLSRMMNMSDEELAAVQAQTGVKMSKEQLQAAAGLMENMSNEDLDNVMKASMAAQTSKTATQQPASSSSPTNSRISTDASSPSNAKKPKVTLPSGMEMTPEMMEFAKHQMQNPETKKLMTEQLKNMDDEQLAAINRQTGQNVSRSQLEMAQNMMSNMSPDAMEAMMKMYTEGAGGAATMPGTASTRASPGMPGVAPGAAAAAMTEKQQMDMMTQATQNPEMMKAMSDMMKNMDPKQLSEMSKQMGMNLSEADSERMVGMMKDIKPETMQTLMSWGVRLKTAGNALTGAKNAMFGSYWRAAITIMVIAVVIGHFTGWF